MKMTEQFEKISENVGAGTWNIGFTNPENGQSDETQFDLEEGEDRDDLWNLWDSFCRENGWDPDEFAIGYIEEGEEG